MLEIWNCTQPEHKLELFARANPRTDSWIVPDLQSKWHIQRKWLSEYEALEQSSVIRATELWKQLAFQLRPDLQLLSQELAQTLIWNWVEPRALPWARTPQSVAVIQKQMQMWVSVFAHPNYQEVMSEWFAANGKAVERWGHWYVLCSQLWEWFRERNLMLKEWLPGLLLNEDLGSVQWDKRLIFDLGPQISQVEGQLVQQLSSHLDVVVVYPQADWVALMPATLRPYEMLLNQPFKGDAAWQPPAGAHLSFGRFSTQLAEVKDAVARVRQWLDQKIPASKIAIVAPDIEEYWPALRMYLEQEGIPVNKAVSSKLGSFIEMSRWIASLRTALSRVKSPDLEMVLFGVNEMPRLSVSEFRRLFTNIYDEGDLKRAQHFFTRKAGLKAGENIALKDFLAWALSLWPEAGNVDRLESLMGVAGQEVPEDLVLPPNEWLSYFEGLLARREETISRPVENGVWCVSLSSAHWLPVTHGIFLNLNESALRTVDRSPVSVSDSQMILQDTGFALGPVERQQLEFELIWFWQKPWTQLRLTFAAHDFQGQVLTPSRLWMWSAFANEQFIKDAEAPLSTRWDEIQRLPLGESLSAGLRAGLERDTTGGDSTWGKATSGSFSASGLKRFWDCPFLFGIEKKFRLSDDAALDLDLDRATRGKLLHAILEQLTVEPIRFDWTDAELCAVIDQCRAKEEVLVGDDRLWPAIRQQHVRLARMFLEFEQEWRGEFPKTKTVARELKIQGYWDVDAGGPVKHETPVSFSGRIDRVDQDSQGRYALIDYKASAAKTRNWKSWLENFDVQLPLYAMLLENGYTELAAAEVTAANFYIVKDRTRRKGYHVKDAGAELYDGVGRQYNFISPEEKQELFHDLVGGINRAVSDIMNGKLNPKPLDKKTCDRCSWRKQCRAPHLN